ncbi:MAG: glycosyltransferase [Synechococcaceae bacterium WB8_1B_136]|nr:glycosyltransferase [Synechococcaceae bacterium WB8_1B_136]
MARWPAPGRCKRRLAAGCGQAAAARLQRRLTIHTLTVARRGAEQAAARLVLAADGLGPRALERWAAALGAPEAVAQGRGNLGTRMQRQLRRGFRAGAEAVVLIGTDLPGLEAADLAEAFHLLENQPLVLGPAADGGYWLIGLNRRGMALAGYRLMAGMPWGTATVLQRTCAAAAAAGLQPAWLAQRQDLDRPEDLRPWRR